MTRPHGSYVERKLAIMNAPQVQGVVVISDTQSARWICLGCRDRGALFGAIAFLCRRTRRPWYEILPLV
jgi:hypothetical protein